MAAYCIKKMKLLNLKIVQKQEGDGTDRLLAQILMTKFKQLKVFIGADGFLGGIFERVKSQNFFGGTL